MRFINKKISIHDRVSIQFKESLFVCPIDWVFDKRKRTSVNGRSNGSNARHDVRNGRNTSYNYFLHRYYWLDQLCLRWYFAGQSTIQSFPTVQNYHPKWNLNVEFECPIYFRYFFLLLYYVRIGAALFFVP